MNSKLPTRAVCHEVCNLNPFSTLPVKSLADSVLITCEWGEVGGRREGL